MELPEGATRIFRPSWAGSVKVIWNDVVRDFLDTGAEWIFSTHHDVAYDPKTLVRLMSWNKPIISALIFMRNNPVVPHIWRGFEDQRETYAMRINETREWFYKNLKWIRFGPFVMEPRPDDALVPILPYGFTSTACTLIHRDVFIDIREQLPNQGQGLWFVCDSEHGGGEDRRFHEYADAVGYEAFVDRSCVVGHIAGDIPTSSADFIAWDAVSTFKDSGEPELEVEPIKEPYLEGIKKVIQHGPD